MSKKKIGVTLPEELHHRVKGEAGHRGLNVEDAYAQALLLWLDKQNDAKPLIPGFVSMHIRRIVEWVIDMFERDGSPEEEALKNSIAVLAKRRSDLLDKKVAKKQVS